MVSYPLRGKKVKYARPFDPAAPIDEREIRLSPPLWAITREFARWTAYSALRSGSPVKSREDVLAALDAVSFKRLFDKGYGPIDKAEFSAWHTETVSAMLDFDSRLTVGWAAKMIAVYLKTTCYLAGFGRDGLSLVIHPPIDNILIKNLRRQFWASPNIMRGLDRFTTIRDMDFEDYAAIIEACELAAEELGYTLFEVEQFFMPE